MATSRHKGSDYPLGNFPQLNPSNSSLTSPVSEEYNCIAWAVEVDNKQYWPDSAPDIASEPAVVWPEGIPNEETIEAFVAFFQLFGYELCDGPGFEKGFLKIVIFVNHRDEPTHACRQVPNKGMWTSKMGWDGVDIELDDLSRIEGPAFYGTAKVYMKKTVQD